LSGYVAFPIPEKGLISEGRNPRDHRAALANGGLKWIQKGGGHYSECNKQLKG
jgi:hypothetical protein